MPQKLKNPERPGCPQDCPHVLSDGGAEFCDFVCPDSKTEKVVLSIIESAARSIGLRELF
jgi:hypothetical protein